MGSILTVLTLTLDGGLIVAIDVVRDPGTLTRVADMVTAGQAPRRRSSPEDAEARLTGK